MGAVIDVGATERLLPLQSCSAYGVLPPHFYHFLRDYNQEPPRRLAGIFQDRKSSLASALPQGNPR